MRSSPDVINVTNYLDMSIMIFAVNLNLLGVLPYEVVNYTNKASVASSKRRVAVDQS